MLKMNELLGLKQRPLTILLVALNSLLLAGCDDDDPVVATLEISATNLTNAQPFSPVALVVHQGDFVPFTVGQAVDGETEELAESGSNVNFMDGSAADLSVFNAISGADVLPPGATETFTVQVLESDLEVLTVSMLTMLVNTNDAITGHRGMAVGPMAVGDRLVVRGPAYDAGTEANTETAATIPGPAGGGEGLNVARDDRNFVSMHSGVVTSADGLATSTLTEAHRFDNPVIQITVTRTL
ncbi:MAG: spondin domain-containing protein [Pseudomonadota bacterium]